VIDVLEVIVGLKPEDRKRLLRQTEFRASDRIILKLIGIYQEKKDAHWLDMCARIYKKTDDEKLKEKLRGDIHRYGEDDAGLRQVLESVTRLRRNKDEDALYTFPAEFYPRLRLFLFDKKLGPEVEAIYLATEKAALPELGKLLADEQEQARRKALDLLVTFPFLTDEEGVLTMIAEALENSAEGLEFRKAALNGIQRFNSPKVVVIATEQLSFGDGKLTNEVLRIFKRCAQSDVLLPELLLALDGRAADLALRVLRPRLDNKMVSLLDDKARRIKSPEGILNALKLLEKRIGKDVWKILTVFAKEKNILVQKGILRHIQTTPDNPLDKNQTKFVTDFAVQLLKSKERDPDLKIKACVILGLYQNNSTLKALSRFAGQDKASDRARRSAIKTISDFSNTKALSALVALERGKKLPLSMKSYASQCLRTMTSGNGKPTWQTWIAKNRDVVDRRFKDADRRRENRLAELETRARRALEAQR
ncbi:MAG: HEAT repeat domain-containing protein, partial [Planctomycetota bacterium]|nr:HEAT repeat domain-containing protein [Planctomycetota bacterium]